MNYNGYASSINYNKSLDSVRNKMIENDLLDKFSLKDVKKSGHKAEVFIKCNDCGEDFSVAKQNVNKDLECKHCRKRHLKIEKEYLRKKSEEDLERYRKNKAIRRQVKLNEKLPFIKKEIEERCKNLRILSFENTNKTIQQGLLVNVFMNDCKCVHTVTAKKLIDNDSFECPKCQKGSYIPKDIIEHYSENFKLSKADKKETMCLECKKCGELFERHMVTLRDRIKRNSIYCHKCEPYKTKIPESRIATYTKLMFNHYLSDKCIFEDVIDVNINGKLVKLRADIIINDWNLHIEVNGTQHYNSSCNWATNQEYYKAKINYYKNKGYQLVEIPVNSKNIRKDKVIANEHIKKILKICKIDYKDFEEVSKKLYLISKNKNFVNSTTSEIKMVEDLYINKFYKVNQIATEMNISKKRVGRILKKELNIEITETPVKRYIDKHKEDIIRELKIDTLENVAVKFGISSQSIRSHINLQNIELYNPRKIFLIFRDNIVELDNRAEIGRYFKKSINPRVGSTTPIEYYTLERVYFVTAKYFYGMSKEDIDSLKFPRPRMIDSSILEYTRDKTIEYKNLESFVNNGKYNKTSIRDYLLGKNPKPHYYKKRDSVVIYSDLLKYYYDEGIYTPKSWNEYVENIFNTSKRALF